MSQHLLSVDQAATRLGLHQKTVLRYIHDGRLKATRVGKAYRIQPADLDAFAGVPVAPPALRSARVTSIVEISDLSARDSSRIVTALQALLTGRDQEAAPMRLDSAYDTECRQLKLVLIGAPGETSIVIAFLDKLMETRS